ncbi:UNVERIFIED_CONTAM: hypothetical protein HDU68_012556 [Siphonaria sp. JEL0065]|nr:hypothetical protein HDU68_012556 [Siphonaria sp. JEL0065]
MAISHPMNHPRTPSPEFPVVSRSATPTTPNIKVPPGLAALSTSASKQKVLYANLNSEDKARLAVVNAFKESTQFTTKYDAKRIIGFGSNGVVLAATHGSTVVAIKIIYKNKASVHASTPAEIEVLKHLSLNSASTTSKLLKHIDDWQDVNHFYVVTELFGSDWLAATSAVEPDCLHPLVFRANNTNISLPFSAGSSDLWAWSYAHRTHIFATEGHSMLPLHPVKAIVKQIAIALNEMHTKGFYHGDVKIENVLIQSGGKLGPQTRLADFGHTKHASFGIKSYGTQEVSPPEFLSDSSFSSQEIDGRAADVFALGMVLYVLLNNHGELPSAVKEVKKGCVGYERLVSLRDGEYPLDDITDLDDEAWDLLFAMTRIDPTSRVTIHQVLSHPFFADV